MNFKDTDFVRCFKPNRDSKPSLFDTEFVEMQLNSSSVVEYQQLMQEDFPINIKYEPLFTTYDFIDQKSWAERSNSLKVLLNCIGIDENNYKLGSTRLFLRTIGSSLLNIIQCPLQMEIKSLKNDFQNKLAQLAAEKVANIVCKESETLLESMVASRENDYDKHQLSEIELPKAIQEKNKPAKKASPEESVYLKNEPSKIKLSKVIQKTIKTTKKADKEPREREEMPPHSLRYDGIIHLPLNHIKTTRCKLESRSLATVNNCI